MKFGAWHVVFVMSTLTAGAQTKTISAGNQWWLGYMTSVQVSEKYSWWNDFHLVPGGFGVVRTGVTRHFAKGGFTGGFARLWLPGPDSRHGLPRWEWRPWAQVQLVLPVDEHYTFTQRLRYDARFRQAITGAVLDESAFVFNHRVRWLTSFRRILFRGRMKWHPFISISNEVLLNFGSSISFNTFDQNRISVMTGAQVKNLQIQIGYMNRFVQTGGSAFSSFHTAVFWVTHRINSINSLKKSSQEMDGE